MPAAQSLLTLYRGWREAAKILYQENNKYLLKLSPNILILVTFYIIRTVPQNRPVSKVAQGSRNGYKVNKCAGARWLKLPASRIVNSTLGQLFSP